MQNKQIKPEQSIMKTVKQITAGCLNGFAISFSDFNDFTVAFSITLALMVCCVSFLSSALVERVYSAHIQSFLAMQ